MMNVDGASERTGPRGATIDGIRQSSKIDYFAFVIKSARKRNLIWAITVFTWVFVYVCVYCNVGLTRWQTNKSKSRLQTGKQYATEAVAVSWTSSKSIAIDWYIYIFICLQGYGRTRCLKFRRKRCGTALHFTLNWRRDANETHHYLCAYGWNKSSCSKTTM